MVIIYYSHAKNTERFVHRHLAKALDLKLPHTQRADRKNPVFRVHAGGPRGDISHITFPHSNIINEIQLEDLDIPHSTDVLFVTPTYGQYNHKLFRAENFTPEPMRQVMEHIADSRHPSDTDSKLFVAVGGNRTFGRDFAVQDQVPSRLAVLDSAFELSGSETEANAIVNEIKEKQ